MMSEPSESWMSEATYKPSQVQVIVDNPTQFRVVFHLPNYNQDDLTVVVKERMLTVAGERKTRMSPTRLAIFHFRYTCEFPSQMEEKFKAEWVEEEHQLIITTGQKN